MKEFFAIIAIFGFMILIVWLLFDFIRDLKEYKRDKNKKKNEKKGARKENDD